MNYSSERLHKYLWENQVFSSIANPVGKDIDFQPDDAEFVVSKEGLIVNVEGWNHPKGMIIGEVLYAPDDSGDKTFFGLPYRKVTLYPGTYEPIPYHKRTNYLTKIDPTISTVLNRQYFSRYKQIFRQADLIAHLPSARALQVALKTLQPTDEMYRDIENLQSILGIKSTDISMGLTGSLLLGKFEAYHDLDVVFHGSTEQNLKIAKSMKDICIKEPHRRIFEGGKAWSIRFFNDYGKLMCTFFTYGERKDAALSNFSMEVIQDDVIIKGEVVNDTHSMYTPSILSLGDVTASYSNNGKSKLETIDKIPLIIYHTASRGDAFNGDIVKAQGAMVEVTQGDQKSVAFCVIDRNKMINLTAPWNNYYKGGFFDE